MAYDFAVVGTGIAERFLADPNFIADPRSTNPSKSLYILGTLYGKPVYCDKCLEPDGHILGHRPAKMPDDTRITFVKNEDWA